MAAIQSLIDSKVDEKFAKFQAEYDELLNKVKKQIASSIKPSSLFPRNSLSEVKGKAPEEEKDTLNTSTHNASRPLTTARKTIPGVKATTVPSRRSDSKESVKNGATYSAAEEKKKEQIELKRKEEEKKKEEAKSKREELERKKKEELDKKK